MEGRRAARDVEPRGDHGKEHGDEDGHANKTEFLTNNRKDIVVVGFGQIVIFHGRVTDAATERTARGECHDGDRRLEAVAVRVAPRVEEDEGQTSE